MAKLDYDELNSTIRYLMFSVFAVKPGVLGIEEDARATVVDETNPLRCRGPSTAAARNA